MTFQYISLDNANDILIMTNSCEQTHTGNGEFTRFTVMGIPEGATLFATVDGQAMPWWIDRNWGDGVCVIAF